MEIQTSGKSQALMDKEPIKILLVEDDAVDCQLVKRLLAGCSQPLEFAIESVGNLSGAIKCLTNRKYDIVIADLGLPDSSGIETVQKLKRVIPDTPIVVLTGMGDEEMGLSAIRNGASDYLIKNLPLDVLLVRTIRHALERKRAKDALRESEEKFKTLYESSRDAIMIVSPEKGFLHGNLATVELFGCKDLEEFISKAPADLSPQYQPDGTASAVKSQQMMAIAIKEGSNLFEWTHKRIDGKEFSAAVLLTKTELKGQAILQATVRDITEHKKKEKLLLDTNNRLQETSQKLFNTKIELEKINVALIKNLEMMEKQVEERTLELKDANKTLQTADANLHMMIDQNADGILIIDNKGIIRFANNAAELLFGRPKEELVGETFGFAAVKDKIIEIEVIQKGGKAVTAEMRTVEIKWEDEMVCLASLRDITERKEMEEKLKETMKIKSEFISVISHELRTPLTAIKGGIDLVLDGLSGNINEEQKEVLDISKRNVDRLARLINNVLDSEKFESGKMKLNIQPNNVNEIARDVYEIFAPTAKNTGINLLLELDDNLPEIGFDSDKITQVLTNLVNNAIKFAEKGNVIIKTTKTEDDILVSVSDTGRGIRKDDISKLFNRFEQLGRGGDRKTGGTGLGLAISKELIEKHNGTICVESTQGKGSTFTFTLPIECPREIIPLLVKE